MNKNYLLTYLHASCVALYFRKCIHFEFGQYLLFIRNVTVTVVQQFSIVCCMYIHYIKVFVVKVCVYKCISLQNKQGPSDLKNYITYTVL